MACSAFLVALIVAAVVAVGVALPWAPSVSSDCFTFQDLGGSDWLVSNGNGSLALPALVPGQVHLDLMRAGAIGDPYADGATSTQAWVREDDWEFARGFALVPALAACAQVLLVADGLDTLARISIDMAPPPPPWVPANETKNTLPEDRTNFTSTYCCPSDPSTLLAKCARACTDTCVGFTTSNAAPSSCCWLYDWAPSLLPSTDGNWWARPTPFPPPQPNATAFISNDMFLRFVYDVTSALSSGAAHNISVRFTSVAGHPWSTIRKEADSWGYDWAPVTQTQGIWQPLYLVGVNVVAILHVVPQILAVPPNPLTPLADGSNVFTCNLTVLVALPAAATIKLTATGTWGGAGASTAVTLSLPAGESAVNLALVAEDVALWWPHTHGGQALYNISVTAAPPDAPAGAAALATRRVGFRSVALVANVTDRVQFYRVNGVELFVMGADWVPPDAFQARLDEARVRDMLRSVVAANMNILRVWGGGIYATDSFLDTCDELGIMVHAEGQFSDATYPFDDTVLALVAAEGLHQARRHSAHPAVIVWVGSNENSPPANDTNWVTFYLRNFLDVIAGADRSRPVWPLCPAHPWAAGVDPASGLPDGAPLQISRTGGSGPPWEAHVYFFDTCSTPQNCKSCADDKLYPATTYASEFGWVGSPSFETLAPVLNGTVDYTLTSPGMTYRENTIMHMNTVYNMVAFNFGAFARAVIDTPSVGTFRRALHLSMLAQADCVRGEVEHYRRGRNGAANTHGTMFWMLGAFWPAPSWDSLEYGGRWKLLHYAAREFYDPLALDAYCAPELVACAALMVHIGNERLAAVDARVVLEAVRFSDGARTEVAAWSASLASAGSGTFFAVNDTAALVRGAGCADLGACMLLVRAVDPHTGNDLRPPAIRSLSLWADATLLPATVTITPLGGGAFRVSADAVAPHTMLHAAELGHFSFNNLLLLPGQSVDTVWVPGPGQPVVPTGIYAVTINGGSASIDLTSE